MNTIDYVCMSKNWQQVLEDLHAIENVINFHMISNYENQRLDI